jgi:sugar/nucleoside kinase (ribokinase family)
MRVTVIGNTVADIIFQLPQRYLRQSEQKQMIELPFGAKLAAEKHTVYPGGSGANVAVGLQSLGVDTSLFTFVGDDAIGSFLLQEIANKSVTLKTTVIKGVSQISVVMLLGAERTIITGHSPDIEFSAKNMSFTDWIHVGPLPVNDNEVFQEILNFRMNAEASLSINPSMKTIEERDRSFLALLKTTKIIFLNRDEAVKLARLPTQATVAEVVKAIHMLGPELVCITLGERGAYASDGTSLLAARALLDKASRVDATGAGDAFASGFLAGYIYPSRTKQVAPGKETLEIALKFAMLNSAAVVGEMGAQSGLQTREQVEKDLPAVALQNG